MVARAKKIMMSDNEAKKVKLKKAAKYSIVIARYKLHHYPPLSRNCCFLLSVYKVEKPTLVGKPQK